MLPHRCRELALLQSPGVALESSLQLAHPLLLDLHAPCKIFFVVDRRAVDHPVDPWEALHIATFAELQAADKMSARMASY